MWPGHNNNNEKGEKKHLFFKKRNIPQPDQEPDKAAGQEPEQQKDEPLSKAGQNVQYPEQDVFECKKCGAKISKSETVANKYVCRECGYYFRIRTKNRIRMVADAGTFEPWFEEIIETNPLNFPGYEEKLAQCMKRRRG